MNAPTYTREQWLEAHTRAMAAADRLVTAELEPVVAMGAATTMNDEGTEQS
jgi:hypothetical protein